MYIHTNRLGRFLTRARCPFGRQGTLLTARTFGEYLEIAHHLIGTTKGAAALALYRKRLFSVSRCFFMETSCVLSV